jgi:hypothetical protein
VSPSASETITVDLRMQPDVVKLLRERDELLAALKDLVDHPELDWAETLIIPRKQFQAARALIARIEKP